MNYLDCKHSTKENEMRLILLAYWLGFKDGFENPYDLAFGYTWPTRERGADLNVVYDNGVNFGQWIGKFFS
jgi:hypothetical protein